LKALKIRNFGKQRKTKKIIIIIIKKEIIKILNQNILITKDLI